MRLSEFNLLFYLLILVNGGRVGVGWGVVVAYQLVGLLAGLGSTHFGWWGFACFGAWSVCCGGVCLFVCFVVRLFGFGLLFVLMLGCFGLSHYFGVLLR